MARNKKKKRIDDIQSAQQHIVMLHEPYPLIYNEETGEPAIQIGTLNIVETKDDELEVESYPVIRPIILNDVDGEINGAGIISPYSMFIAEPGSEMSAWRNICILTPRIDIEDLFLLLQEYCNLADTMIQDPADIIEGLKAYGYKVAMPNAKEIIIHLEPDDSRIWWKSEYSIAGGPVDPRIVTNMWFMASGGGSLGHNIDGLVENALYYDKLFLEQGLSLPTYKFVTSELDCEGEIKYINENFTNMLIHERGKYKY